MSATPVLDAPWLYAGLSLARVGRLEAAGVARVLGWLTAVLSEVGGLPAPGLVIDVALLLGGAPLNTAVAQPVEHARLRVALGHYEDRVLGRLVADRRLTACRDAYARLSEPLRAQAVAVVVSSMVRREAGVLPVEPGWLRKLRRMAPEDAVRLSFEAWRESTAFETLAASYEAFTGVGRSASSLLTDADVFTLENLEVLGELGQRLAVQQIVDAAEALASGWPRRVKLLRRARGHAPTALEEESAYPAGGFSSMSTSGTLENLVTSELVFMDAKEDRSGIDLFDVRYAEGELLYYTRDEALILRPRRLIAFVLAPSLASARLKDEGVPWQRGVVVLGWMLAAIRALERWLGETDLHFLCVVEQADGELRVLQQEQELVELLLTEWREKGSLELVTLSRASWQDHLRNEARRADTRVVVLGAENDVEPTPLGDDVLTARLDARAREWTAWCDFGLATLRQLV